MAEHTPGPWSVNAHREVVTAAGRTICRAHLDATTRSADETAANACLIAAAPDLVEVAPDAADLLDHYAEYIRGVPSSELERHPYLPSVQDAARGLRDALAKATGQ